ncbi:MAG: hypothetical protein Q8R34_01350 [bacterium]|nr:hypothetical protein [bacterium]
MKKEKGVIIIFTAILLGILVSISLGLAAIFTPKIQLVTEVKNSVGALFAAESGLEWCLYNNQIAPSPTPPPPVMANGATYQLTPADCSGSTFKSVGTFRGVTRAFEVTFQ